MVHIYTNVLHMQDQLRGSTMPYLHRSHNKHQRWANDNIWVNIILSGSVVGILVAYASLFPQNLAHVKSAHSSSKL